MTTRSTNRSEQSSSSSSFSSPRNILPVGYNDSRGFHHIAMKDRYKACKTVWKLCLFLGSAVLIILCIWDISPYYPVIYHPGSSPSPNSVIPDNPQTLSSAALPISKKEMKQSKLKMDQNEPKTEQNEVKTDQKPPEGSDSQGCLHSYPEIDQGRHIVLPPGGVFTLVCCQSTAGPFNIAVHSSWAPLGAKRFLDMVNQKFFSSKVGMFRALKNFLVQFGLSGDPAVQSAFEHSAGGRGNLEDDPNWLPEGPPGREINGVKRFQKGYLAYAGAGKNSRGTQLIMAFEDNLYLGGGSPWEVPFGQLVGENSFESLGKLYTGYGEKVSQGKIRNRGLEYLMDFPQLSYITSCDVMSENNPWTYVHSTLPTQG